MVNIFCEIQKRTPHSPDHNRGHWFSCKFFNRTWPGSIRRVMESAFLLGGKKEPNLYYSLAGSPEAWEIGLSQHYVTRASQQQLDFWVPEMLVFYSFLEARRCSLLHKELFKTIIFIMGIYFYWSLSNKLFLKGTNLVLCQGLLWEACQLSRAYIGLEASKRLYMPSMMADTSVLEVNYWK